MKIAIIVGSFPSISETFIVNQIVALMDKGHTVSIYSNYVGNTERVHEVITQYKLLEKVHYKKPIKKKFVSRVFEFFKFILLNFFQLDWLLLFRTLNFLKFGKRALNLSIFFQCEWFLLKDKSEIIHVHFGHNAIPLAELKADGFLKNSKLVVSFHGFDINPSKIEKYRNQYSTLFREANRLIANTLYTKNLLLKVNPDIRNIEIIPVGLDTALFSKSKSNNNAFRILYCGRLVKFKGSTLTIDILLELLRRGYENINLVLIGEGELRKELEAKIKKHKLEKFVSLKGNLIQKDIIKYLANSNVFLLPGTSDSDGRCENQGLVIQEAQAMELPVVVSDVGGMKYGLIPNITGYVVKENDITGFADILENIINNPKKAAEMGKKGRVFVVENYDSNVLVNNLISIYKKP